jgi:hypothetical protein
MCEGASVVKLVKFGLSVILSALLAPREDVLRVLVYSSECKLSYRQKGSLINAVY